MAKAPKFAVYLDTSALVKLFIEEAGSDLVRSQIDGPRAARVILVSRLGYTEAAVSMARLVHLGKLPVADLPALLGSLDDYWDQSIQEVPLSDSVHEEARQLAQRFPLRTYDAIHLASAKEARKMLRGIFDGEVRFLAFDNNLVGAAITIGFPVPGR